MSCHLCIPPGDSSEQFTSTFSIRHFIYLHESRVKWTRVPPHFKKRDLGPGSGTDSSRTGSCLAGGAHTRDPAVRRPGGLCPTEAAALGGRATSAPGTCLPKSPGCSHPKCRGPLGAPEAGSRWAFLSHSSPSPKDRAPHTLRERGPTTHGSHHAATPQMYHTHTQTRTHTHHTNTHLTYTRTHTHTAEAKPWLSPQLGTGEQPSVGTGRGGPHSQQAERVLPFPSRSPPWPPRRAPQGPAFLLPEAGVAQPRSHRSCRSLNPAAL